MAVYVTRFVASYELLDAAYAIPLGALLGFLAIALARRAQRRNAVRLGRDGGERPARLGRLLGIIGLCMSASALVSLAVYGLLEYAGTRD